MLRNTLIVALVAMSPAAVAAQSTSQPAAEQAKPAAKLSTADTSIGDLIDNPASKAVVDKHMPGFSSNPQVEMARGMTLRAIQPMVPDQIKAETLDKIDEELAKL